MATVLVTGAAGTVGSYTVPLVEAAGHRVIASDRVSSSVRTPVRGEVRAGDLRDPVFVDRLVQGCDYIVHTAAQLDDSTAGPAMAEVNTIAVERLYRAAMQARVKRFVHVSSAMLYAMGERGPLSERALLSPRGVHGHTKLAAEEYLRAHMQEGSLPWTIVRAAPIYGRRGKHSAATLLAIGPILRLVSPILPSLSGGPSVNLVHAEDVARALVFLLTKKEGAFQTYNVSDDDPLPLGERITETFRGYRLPTWSAGTLRTHLWQTPARFLQTPGPYHALDTSLLAAWRLVVLRHKLKSAFRPRVDRETLTLLYNDLVLDTAKLRALGWTPRFPRFREGFRDVLPWYQAERWVPRYT